MTENKRFNLRLGRFYDGDCIMGNLLNDKQVLQLLNSLSNENNQLREQNLKITNKIKELELQRATICNGDVRIVDENARLMQQVTEYSKKAKELEKENEELKSDLDYFKSKNGALETGISKLERENRELQSVYTELTKLRCIKKNLSRIKSEWNWIMEAIEYD